MKSVPIRDGMARNMADVILTAKMILESQSKFSVRSVGRIRNLCSMPRPPTRENGGRRNDTKTICTYRCFSRRRILLFGCGVGPNKEKTMIFSDDDLKRLKEDMDRLGDFPVGNYRLRPLLARLDAAERLAERFQDNTPEDTALFNAWRKSAGKDEK